MTDAVFLGDSWLPFVAMLRHCKKFGIWNPWATPLSEMGGNGVYVDKTIQGSTSDETLKTIRYGLNGLATSRDTQWFISTGTHDIADWNFTDQGEQIATNVCNIVRHIVVHHQARKICIGAVRCDQNLMDALGFLYPFTRYSKINHITGQLNASLLEKIDELHSLYPNVTFHLHSQQVSYIRLLERWICELYIKIICFLHIWLMPYFSAILG